jgi:hypothetical protein
MEFAELMKKKLMNRLSSTRQTLRKLPKRAMQPLPDAPEAQLLN